MPPFGKVLVANRGEIAIRVMKAVKEMGMKAVAVYSEADKNSLHVKYADEAYYIGPSPAIQSYLNIESIISVAEKAHVDAVHPGYGFLSERADFAEAVEKAGVVFIGPSPHAMNSIKSKLDGKRLAKASGVPISPGSDGPVENLDEAIKIADRIGYPIMVKAAYGGGGTGITKVDSQEQLIEVWERNKRLAYQAFGKADLYIEKAAVNPRHIEFQLIGDKYGNYVVAWERECTIQRRNQKLIEEAPSPVVKMEERERMFEPIMKFGQLIRYHTLGTFETVFSDVSREFYFLELNKRLQVEHPITETIFRIDLVKLQIRLAADEHLPFTQEELNKRVRGHAIEYRINSEDPMSDFSGSSGTITYYEEPSGPGVRVDSGITLGSYVPPFYDSLIAKLIVYGEDRISALQSGQRALSDFKIGGVKTTIELYKWITREEDFVNAKFTTAYISQKSKEFLEYLKRKEMTKAVIASVMYSKGYVKKSGNGKKETVSNNKNKWKTYGIMSQSSYRVLW
ncbi:acetyl-CoA carboxylase biotin carboxylase subunit [Sulfolobus acidocaldarius]|uniref:Pyruvate carboxylase subunit A n=4 Tax=Sulfolobus acidocaldarius TaxID=2285 RepID=Q4JC03_SULAC|nr:biotin carboxylase N-terminal domain-containing protein [Sulfolobus acidocaldarius]AAY79676.1 pyruvate carboxylase subunit A [Sulfolobus acidocaldarius DSM 639]AGE70234.1 pyruvate carboxylase subunit A [Sulfolobus acidocaldarius N8]AGE72509.1 pyruvate carboxylase subunit A [Sulfolobus acidocaldarius Ron12/I]ALU29360.1 pyruvate carboxylase subunit A [Sulfolobus acidocaldarius]ALU32089.1 pyruvate carboxylase subunit A [Sulfolobus acidocaldarius]